MLGQARDNVMFVPLTFLKKVLSSDRRTRDLRAPQGGMAGLDRAEDEVRTILRSARKTRFKADDPFGSRRPSAVQSLWQSISQGAYLAMILISGISLVVGAIVIANIMFVSVVERTQRDRPAEGARRALAGTSGGSSCVESAHAVAIGGVIGVALGALIALARSARSSPPRCARVHPPRPRPSRSSSGVVAGLAPASAAASKTPGRGAAVRVEDRHATLPRRLPPRLRENVRFALIAIREHKLRAGLTDARHRRRA